MYTRMLEKNTQSEKGKKDWGQYPELSVTSTRCTPREKRRRERITFGSECMPTLGPSTCPSKIFSLLDGATICIRSSSFFLSALYIRPVPRFSNGQFHLSIFRVRIQPREFGQRQESAMRDELFTCGASVLTGKPKR